MTLLINSSSPLTTPTFDGSGECLHPTVLDFGQGLLKAGATSWNGYRYWLAMTPYYLGQDVYELPSLLCSNDNETWVVPSGLTSIRGTVESPSTGAGNPLIYQTYYAPARDGDLQNFFNDPHMNYIPETDELWIHFNRVYRDLGTTPYTYLAGTGTKLLKITNGLSVSVQDCVNTGQTFPTQVSPTQTGDAFQMHVTLWNGSTWYGYRFATHNYSGTDHYVIHRQTSSDGLTWSPFSEAIVPSVPHLWDSDTPSMRLQGHWTGLLREDNNTVDIIALVVPTSDPASTSADSYMFARTYLDNPTLWEYPFGTDPLLVSGGVDDWDDALYRASFTVDESTKTLNMWYSARNVAGNVRYIGYSDGVLAGLPSLYDLDVILMPIEPEPYPYDIDVVLMPVTIGLPIYIEGKQVLEMYVGGKRVTGMYVGGKSVF